jgi:hypothetical protein
MLPPPRRGCLGLDFGGEEESKKEKKKIQEEGEAQRTNEIKLTL